MTDLPTQPRIAALPPSGDDRQLNIFRTLAHHKPLFKAFLTLGSQLLGSGELPEREREIVVLRIGRRARSEYEFGQHTTIGLAAGLTEAEIARIADLDADADGWSDDDATLLALADEICADDVVSDPTWQRLTARWNDAEMLELLMLAGFYRMVSGVLNSAGVALEPGTPGWPGTAADVRRAPRDQA